MQNQTAKKSSLVCLTLECSCLNTVMWKFQSSQKWWN